MFSEVSIIKGFIPFIEANDCFNYLLANIEWLSDLYIIGTDKTKKIKRKMAYIADGKSKYKYSNFELPTAGWNEELIKIKLLLNSSLGMKFNSVLLNLYENGKDEIKWHSDKEKQLGETPVIACVNLGATRKFWFLRKSDGMRHAYEVSNGDLLIMERNCQANLLHAILKEKEVKDPRISLTFRYVE